MKDRWLGIAVMLASIVSLIVSSYTGTKWYNYTRCQAAVDDILIKSTNAQAKAADVDRDALDSMVKSILTVKPGEQGKVRQALQDYVDARARANAQRAANPLPKPHTC